ncbi:hypothetical protein J6590_101626 [Homalodisca vitripennis]|nr:hypothetical protein J6590_101626 [Homalodisca vitripennis]
MAVEIALKSPEGQEYRCSLSRWRCEEQLQSLMKQITQNAVYRMTNGFRLHETALEREANEIKQPHFAHRSDNVVL